MRPSRPRLAALVAVLTLAAAPAVADSDYDRAAAAFAAGDWAAAAAGMESVLEASPDWAPGHLFLGQCYWLLGRGDEGHAEMDEAARLDPATDLGSAYLAVGQQLYRLERHDEAVRPCELALEHAEGDTAAAASRQLADALLLAGRFEDARAAFQRHVREHGADRRTLWRLALACRKLDALPCAVDAARRVAELPGDDPTGGQLPRYLATWSRSLVPLERDDDARAALWDRAVDDARRWVEAEPASGDARRLHAHTLIDAGREDEAITAYCPAADTGDCVAAVLCARARVRHGDAAAGERSAREAAACAPDDPLAWSELGAAIGLGLATEYDDAAAARADRRRCDEALAALERALALADPGEPVATRSADLARQLRDKVEWLDATAAELELAEQAEANAIAERTLQRCRTLEWTRRSQERGLSEDERRWYDEHDCAALVR